MTPLPTAGLAATKRLLVLARDLLQASDLKSVLELVGPACHELLVADEALLLVNLGRQEVVSAAFDRRGYFRPAVPPGALSRLAEQALAEQAPILLPKVTLAAAAGQPPSAEAGSLVVCPFPPIRAIGVLAARWSRRRSRSELVRQMAVLRSISELTGAALGNVDFRLMLEAQVAACTTELATAARQHALEIRRRQQREEEFRRLSSTDVLTGMLNRRGFFLHAERSYKLACRQGLPSALIFADIDGLKAVNDRLGHDAGDRLIQDSALILRNSLRDSDVVARFGGDEFAAFTLDSAQPAAILVRIQENIDSFHRTAPRPYQVSFSTGIVRCDPASPLALADYLALADKAMYEQKRRRPS